MGNPICDFCENLVHGPIQTRDGFSICSSCFQKSYANGVPTHSFKKNRREYPSSTIQFGSAKTGSKAFGR